MNTLRSIALSCCVLSALAGVIRTFWPHDGFRAVINAVLTLYIIASLLRAVQGADWQELSAKLSRFTENSADVSDYSDYGAALGLQQSAEALQTLLRQSGIAAVVQPDGDGVRVRIAYPADREQAEALLRQFGGTLVYTVEEAE